MPRQSYGIWPNQGQVTDDQGNAVPEVSFYTTGATPRAYFRKDGAFSLVLSTVDTVAGVDTLRRLDLSCVGTDANFPDPVVWEMKDQYANFYLPQCGPNGATNVHPWARVIYPEVYPLIDMHVYSGAISQKLAFVIRPGGDPKKITLQFEGQDSLDVDVYGNLKLMLQNKWVVLPQAVAYQVDNGGNIIPVNWTASFTANNNVGRAYFDFDAFDHSLPLVFLVGPPALGGQQTYDEYGLCWSTYFGAEGFDVLTDIQADSNGDFYVAGRTESGMLHFPHGYGTTETGHGSSVATLSKFDQAHHLLWTSFHGGASMIGVSNRVTTAAGIAIKDNPIRIYMAGTTNENNLSTWDLPGAYNVGTSFNLADKGFVARYGFDGALQWCSYFGVQDVSIQGIDALPGEGGIVVSGTTQGSLPNTPLGSYQGNGDAFITLFNAADNIAWSRFHGGSGTEDLAVVRTNGQKVMLTGNTNSPDIPLLANVPGVSFQEGYHGAKDVFIAQYTLQGAPVWATYFGSPTNDALAPQGVGMVKDLYVAGACGVLADMVHGQDWYDDVPFQDHNGFIARFKDNTNEPLWISYLGGGTSHSPYCLTLDPVENLTVAGYTSDPPYDALNWPGHYFQDSFYADEGGLPKDAFIMRFNPSQHRLWSTLFGGNAGGLNQPQNIRAVLDLGGSIYAVGYSCTPNNAPGNYFPLDGEENSGYFFNPDYNYDGFAGGAADGFITEFCNEATIGVAETALPGSGGGLRTAWSPSGQFSLLGLVDGPHQLRVYDAQGRLVLREQVHSQAGQTTWLPLQDPGMAVYFLVVDNARTGRLVPIH
jgi:hypothetical protein